MTGPMKMLVVFLNEADRLKDEPLFEVVMRRLRHLEIAGATALNGVMGFGLHHRMHHEGLFGISDDKPITVTVVDTEPKIRMVIREIRSLMPKGLMLVLDVEAVPEHQNTTT